MNDKYIDEPPRNRYPVDFETWPRGQQIVEVTPRMTRRGLILSCLTHSGLQPVAEDIDDDTRLTKKELAAIHLTLEGIDYDQ